MDEQYAFPSFLKAPLVTTAGKSLSASIPARRPMGLLISPSSTDDAPLPKLANAHLPLVPPKRNTTSTHVPFLVSSHLEASIYDVRTERGEGVLSKADIVSNLSEGGCMNLRTRRGGGQTIRNLCGRGRP